MSKGKIIILICILVLIMILILRKVYGQKGTWDTKEEVEEYAIMSTDLYRPIQTRYEIVSSKNKPFSQQFSNIPEVNKYEINQSIGEKICRNYLENRFQTKFCRDRPHFLRNPITNSFLELDCFSADLNLALEYNGKQHYAFVPKFHRDKTEYYNQKYRDEIKKRLCYENGIDLIEVPFTVSHKNIPSYIESALIKLGRI